MFLNVVALGRTPPNGFGPPLTDSVSGKLLANFSEMLTPPNVFTPPNRTWRFTVLTCLRPEAEMLRPQVGAEFGLHSDLRSEQLRTGQ